MKPSSEDGATQAGGPWEECFEAAAQLALRAGQVSAAPGARQAHSDLGQSGRRAWADGDPEGPAGTWGREPRRGSAQPTAHCAPATPAPGLTPWIPRPGGAGRARGAGRPARSGRVRARGLPRI